MIVKILTVLLCWLIPAALAHPLTMNYLKFIEKRDSAIDPLGVIVAKIAIMIPLWNIIMLGTIIKIHLTDTKFKAWKYSNKRSKKRRQLRWLILLPLLLTFSQIKSQVFVTTNPMQGHHNIGTLINKSIDKDVGIYANILYGNVIYKDFKCNSLKLGAGISYTIPNDHKDIHLLLGMSSNNLYNINNNNPYINTDRHNHTSVNIGFFADLPFKRKPKILFLTDINNWESQLGIGFNF